MRGSIRYYLFLNLVYVYKMRDEKEEGRREASGGRIEERLLEQKIYN